MALHEASLADPDERRSWTVWVPPARRSGWDVALAALAVALMAGALAAGETLAQPVGALGTWLPHAANAMGTLGARLAPPRIAVVATDELAEVAPLEMEAPPDLLMVDETATPAEGLRLVHDGPEPWTDLALENRLHALLATAPGRMAVAVRHLPTGASVAVNADVPMPPASVLKLGVLGEVFAARAVGILSLDERLPLLPQDWEDGAGVLQWRIGNAVPLREAARLMIMWSDNVAANALLRRVGFDGVNRFYETHAMTASRVYQDLRPDVTTATETAALLTELVTGQLGDEEDSLLMLQYLAQWQAAAWIKDGLPPDTLVAHKSGQLLGVRNDAAIAFGPSGPYVVVVLADLLIDERAAETMIGRIARTVHEHLEANYPAGLFGG